jgi:maleylacetate reductase
MRAFVRTAPAPRVVFGVDTLTEVAAELDRLGAARVVVLSTPGGAALAERVAAPLGARVVGRFAAAAPHTPVEVTDRAVAVVGEHRADTVVSVGGGSTTGLGKALAARLGVRHLVVATTYAGSEVTSVLGETAAGRKTTRSGPEIRPDAVVYDVRLTLGLPWTISVTSAVNATAHAVEALYGPDRTEQTDRWAVDAVRSLVGGLSALRGRLDDLEVRSELLYGAWLAGTCLDAVEMGLHHKLCHALGGAFDLPHAATHTVVLAYAMAYNAPAARGAMALVAGAMAAEPAPRAVQSLVRDLDGPRSLAELGMARADLGRAADLVLARPFPNPRPVTRSGLVDLLSAAWAGDRVEPA